MKDPCVPIRTIAGAPFRALERPKKGALMSTQERWNLRGSEGIADSAL